MKKTRRKELKTNELSAILKQIYENALQYSNYLIGGALVIVLVLVAGLIYRQNKQNALQAARKEYNEIRQLDATVDPNLIDRARILASENSSDRNLGPAALELQATMNYKLAMSIRDPKEKARKIEHLKEAKEIYQQLIDKFSTLPNVTDRANFSLAAVEESLVVMGESSIDQVREHYRKLAENEKSPFKPLAESLIETLDEKTKPLEIVASRPAEKPLLAPPDPPTTQPKPVITRSKLKKIDKPTSAPATSTAPAK
ncbi:MAG: hypothetical protein ACYTF1_13765 [Planctomycetota bacterium]|jgi:hypothetical protein